MAINYKEISHSSLFIQQWKQQVKDTLEKIHPEWDDDSIERILNQLIEENIQLPKVTLDNNYTGESRESNLLSVLDWCIKRKPLIAGNASFYKNQHEAINPIAKMLDGFLSERKAIKKRMFSVEDTESDLYKDLDRAQGNQKILANSYYGGSGSPTAAFYSKWSGPATTGTAQSVIATTETFFEGFLVDNYKFIDLNECFVFLNQILSENYQIHNWIVRVDKYDVFDRLKDMFYEDSYNDEYGPILISYLNHLDENDLTRIFYKNNFIEFTRRHQKVVDKLRKIFESVENLEYIENESEIPDRYLSQIRESDPKKRVKAYNSFVNKQAFMDPNSPPDTIIEYLKKLNEYYIQYVYMPFMSIDRIHRLKYFPRKTVCVVDTDSNIMSLDLWVKFCYNEILEEDYGRDEEHNNFIIINTMAYFITNAVAGVLNNYGIHSNIPDDFRGRFSMKNEFYFNRLIIGKKKKRYISSIILREGNLMNPPKSDVKGFDFRKATTSEEMKKIFDSIVDRRIIKPRVPDIIGILSDLREIESTILQSIKNGETRYLPLGNAKELEAFKDPYSQQGVRGSLAWNFIYPDNQIEYPSKVSMLKLNIFTEDDMSGLAVSYPREYEIIKKDIFHSPIKEIASKGLQVFAIPSNSGIPEWCQPYIDYNTVINNILGQFKGVLDVFGINCPEVGKQIKTVNRKTKRFSNIVRF